MGISRSSDGSLGAAEESVFGNGVSPTFYIPISSENVKEKMPFHDNAGIYGSPMVQTQTPGIIEISGGLNMEVDAPTIGYLLKWWNGSNNSGYAVATLPGSITAAPTGVVGSGGTLANGAYLYVVAAVLTRTVDGKKLITNPSAESATVTTTTGNNTVALTWVNPSAPTGYTLSGTMVYRTALGGSSGTEVFLTYVSSGTSYSDTGTANLTVGAVIPQTVYQHTFTPPTVVPGVNRLKSFTITKNTDNGGSQTIAGCRMNTFAFNVGDMNNPVTATFDMMGHNVTPNANYTSPSFTVVNPMMNWQTIMTINGTETVLLEAFSLHGTNNLTKIPGLYGSQFYRDFYPGLRNLNGSLTMSFEDYVLYNQWFTFLPIALNTTLQSPYSTTPAGVINVSGTYYYPWFYTIIMDMPAVNVEEADANLNQKDQLKQVAPFKLFKDPTKGYDLKFSLFNLTPTY